MKLFSGLFFGSICNPKPKTRPFKLGHKTGASIYQFPMPRDLARPKVYSVDEQVRRADDRYDEQDSAMIEVKSSDRRRLFPSDSTDSNSSANLESDAPVYRF